MNENRYRVLDAVEKAIRDRRLDLNYSADGFTFYEISQIVACYKAIIASERKAYALLARLDNDEHK